MFVFRKTTNIWDKKELRLLATSFFFAQALPKKFGEEHRGNLPIFTVDAVFYFGSFYFSLYQSCIFQLFQMLRNSCFRNRQYLMYISEKTRILLYQKFKNCHSRWMSHCFGEPGKLLLSCSIFFIIHFHGVVCCSQNYEHISECASVSDYFYLCSIILTYLWSKRDKSEYNPIIHPYLFVLFLSRSDGFHLSHIIPNVRL